MDLLDHFQNVKVHHLMDMASDRCPLLLSVANIVRVCGKHWFHSEALWTKRADCEDVIAEAWNGSLVSRNPAGIVEGLRCCKAALTSWSSEVYGNIPKKIQEKKKLLAALTKSDTDRQNGGEINKLRKKTNELLDGEETWWSQRSHVQWLSEGDRNTKYFHNRASKHRRKNTITGLWNENEQWCEDRSSIADAAVSYFEDVYTLTSPSQIEEVAHLIPAKVTADMNESLIKDFTVEEVQTTLSQMHPTKAPGPDSMSAIFYQKYWKIVGADVTNVVLNVLNSDMSLADINKTNIALCVTTVSYSVLINGEASASIVPSKGLRQGDPLSSYLFLLCTEAFSAFIADANNSHELSEISICRGCPKVTHLFFADDSLLFCKAARNEGRKLVDLL
ncbi:uncharacterized protein LOC142635183 [Castanea sativa]|uniref:uncharacterized protein LOC142635183 n=1 Tax=Castanea sativa TaxID=21020 RepID=UPI003F654887